MRILTIDIETTPNLAHAWRLWDENIGLEQLLEPTEILCWAAKWYGKSKVEFSSEFHDGREAMIQQAWDLLDDADVVLHYNGRRFDVPHLNREFLSLGFDPPAPFQQIDLLETVKRQFKFPSNRLAYVSKALGLGGKVSHEGHALWIGCMAGETAAWERMRRYNIGDVKLTEQLYDRLLPWIQRHPSHGAMSGKDVCPACGSDDLQHRGHSYTRIGSYQRYQCNACGKWSRATRRSSHTKITEVAC
jgi:DNA polymerase elongation subunit (family B)